jgi:hypothetical protein
MSHHAGALASARSRGVLNPLDASPPGSAWWRAVRLGMAGVFLSLRRVLPNRHPLADDVER